MTKKIAVIGASGYTGAQLSELIFNHHQLHLYGLYVSENSLDKHKQLADLYPCYSQVKLPLQGLSDAAKEDIATQCDAVALATDHKVSLHLAAWFHQQGLTVFDLSGAYRFKDINLYPQWYGFEHEYPELLAQSVYGLTQWHASAISQTKMIAVPGCYPTASLLALKPIADMVDQQACVVINAVSGVSGAGRKASLHTSFCEVSLAAYGVLNHRHQPEIEAYSGLPTIFTPHLGNFKRGIHATVTVKMQPQVTTAQISQAFEVYSDSEIVHVQQQLLPKVDDVVNSERCHIGWCYDSDKSYLVMTSVIDNLMKGAASQTLECITIHYGLTA